MDAFIPDIERHAFDLVAVIAHVDEMSTGALNRAHLLRYGMIAIAGKPIHHCTYDKMRAKLHCQTIKLINVALPIADVNTPLRLPKQCNRLT